MVAEVAANSAAGVPPTDELIARARALAPELRPRQQPAEKARAVPAETIDAIRDADLFRVLQPGRFGGFEAGLDAFAEIVMEIAAGCGSTGWLYAGAAECQRLAAMFPAAAQDEVWTPDSRAITGAVLDAAGVARREGGGWRLSGAWKNCAGATHCAWMILGARIETDGGATGEGLALVPVAELTRTDGAGTFGLVAAGLCDLSCDDLLVPAHRLLAVSDAQSGSPPGALANAAPLYRVPFHAARGIGACAAIVGMARGALAAFVDDTRDRRTRGAALARPAAMAALEPVQLHTGEAAAAADAAGLLLARDCRDIMATAAAGDSLTIEQRARHNSNRALAARLAREAVDGLYFAAGGAAIHEHNPLQRYWRDAHAGALLAELDWDAAGAPYGRVALGQPPGPGKF